jgi:tetrahydromethanopterin S-methyltransferase subunit G
LARKFVLSEDALQRHRKRHLPQAVAQAAEEKAVEKGADLLDRIRAAEAKLSGYERIAYSLAQKGFRQGDDALVLKSLSEARRSAVESRMRLWDLELRVAETREIAARLEEIERQIGGDAWVR